MLYKVKGFVNVGILKVIHHTLFQSHIHYIHYAWMYYMGTECMHNQSSFPTSKESTKIDSLIHEREAYTATLFFKLKLVKLTDKNEIKNSLFISKHVNNKLPPIFNSWFIFSSTSHNYDTPFSSKGHLYIPIVTTTTYGKGA